MREVAERRQQLELEHEQALAILKFKQDEIKRLQRVRATVSFAVLHILHKSLLLEINDVPKVFFQPCSCKMRGFAQQEATFGQQ